MTDFQGSMPTSACFTITLSPFLSMTDIRVSNMGLVLMMQRNFVGVLSHH